MTSDEATHAPTVPGGIYIASIVALGWVVLAIYMPYAIASMPGVTFQGEYPLIAWFIIGFQVLCLLASIWLMFKLSNSAIPVVSVIAAIQLVLMVVDLAVYADFLKILLLVTSAVTIWYLLTLRRKGILT